MWIKHGLDIMLITPKRLMSLCQTLKSLKFLIAISTCALVFYVITFMAATKLVRLDYEVYGKVQGKP